MFHLGGQFEGAPDVVERSLVEGTQHRHPGGERRAPGVRQFACGARYRLNGPTRATSTRAPRWNRFRSDEAPIPARNRRLRQWLEPRRSGRTSSLSARVSSCRRRRRFRRRSGSRLDRLFSWSDRGMRCCRQCTPRMSRRDCCVRLIDWTTATSFTSSIRCPVTRIALLRRLRSGSHRALAIPSGGAILRLARLAADSGVPRLANSCLSTGVCRYPPSVVGRARHCARLAPAETGGVACCRRNVIVSNRYERDDCPGRYSCPTTSPRPFTRCSTFSSVRRLAVNARHPTQSSIRAINPANAPVFSPPG